MTPRRGFLALAGAVGLARPLEAQPAAARFGVAIPPSPDGLAAAILAGGCFWCMEPPFDRLTGVEATTSGYTGGVPNRPTYQQVSAGGTGHIEAVHVLFDPARVTYAQLLTVFWHNVDPLDAGGQFCDRGAPYATAIFTLDAEQRSAAEASKAAAQARLGRPLVTPIRDGTAFWPAEEYHQDYYLKNPVRYRFYRWNCGRDARLQAVWGEAAADAH